MTGLNYRPYGLIFFILWMWALPAAQAQTGKLNPVQEKYLKEYLRPAVFSLTMVMVHDVVNPPAASRYYAYVMLGAYDIVSAHDGSLARASGFIRHYPVDAGKGIDSGYAAELAKEGAYDYRIAAAYSILESGRVMLPSGYLLEEEETKFLNTLRGLHISQELIDRSFAVGRKATAKMVAWAKGDNYLYLSARLRYSPLRKDSTWYPTPPSYIEAVEPNWRIIRPMVVDSANQFVPPPLVHFSTDTASAFYHLAKEVYNISRDTGARLYHQRTLAGFWDCNPFAVTTSGHLAIGLKKISPGGHWMDIAGIAAGAAGLDFSHTVETQTLVAVALMDAFICCWDEKYRSNRIRPESYINRYIDARWVPYLQTPPFPEYTSGHSVISTASAEVLTFLLGDAFEYTDNTEERWDIAPRHFHSFRSAAEEAAISRIYGGIHYRDAIVNGQVMGKEVAAYILSRLKIAGVRPLR